MPQPSRAVPVRIRVDQVSLTRRQVSQLAQAAGVSPDDVREAMQEMPSKGSFLMSLAYVHMLRHPVVVRIENESQRRFAAVREGMSLKASWEVDKGVKEIVAVGREQARTGKITASTPAPVGWLERIAGAREEAAPAPRMAP